MGTVDKQGVVAMQEFLVFALAQTYALAKLLIEKGLITKAEFMQKLSAERAGYRRWCAKMSARLNGLACIPHFDIGSGKRRSLCQLILF